MIHILSALSVAVVVFASTNVDDAFLLAAFFGDPHLRPSTIVAGQFLGIGALVAVSTFAALPAITLPEGFTAFLGVVPLALGLHGLRGLWCGADTADLKGGVPRQGCGQLLGVAGIVVANGGDNLGVYIPLFASAPATVPLYAAVFALMTGLWCLVGYLLVSSRAVAEHVRRYGHVVLPFVLIALGLWILSGIRCPPT